MALLGSLLIDGVDCWTTYGVSREGYADDFLSFPARKPSLTFDYPDQNGVSIDLSAPVFSARTIKLSFWMVATTESTFWTQYQAFITAVQASGTRSIFIAQLQSTLTAYYVSMGSMSALSPIHGSTTGVYMKFSILFSETTPKVPAGTAVTAAAVAASGMGGYIGRDGLLWLRWGWNYKNLDGLLSIVGDSQYQGITGADHNPVGKIRDKISVWQTANHPAATLSVIAMGGTSSIQMLPLGDNIYVLPAHNIDEALRSNPDIVLLGDTSNDYTLPLHEDMPAPPALPSETVVANKLRIKQYCEAQGVPCFIVSLYPRSSFDVTTRGRMSQGVSQELATFTDGSYVAAWPALVTPDGLYNLQTQYDIGDQTHLNDAGNSAVLSLITGALTARLGTITGISFYEIQFSYDQATWYLLDTVTDQNVVKKQYPAPALGTTYYRTRNQTTAGVYSPYSAVAKIVNAAYSLDVVFFFTEKVRMLPVGVCCFGDPYASDHTYKDTLTGISISTKMNEWGGFGTGGSFDYNGELKDDGGGFFTGCPSAQRSCWFTQNKTLPTNLYLSGLNPANQYTLYLLSSMSTTVAASINTNNDLLTTTFAVNNASIGKQVAPGNTSAPISYTFIPNTDGTLVITMGQFVSGSLMIISALALKVTGTVSQLPVSNAGANQSMNLPTNSTNLDGSASTPTLGYIKTWKWEKLLGGVVNMPGTGSSLCAISGMVEGTYQFKLTVTNNYGYSAASTVIVTVSPAGGPTTSKFAFSNAGVYVPGYINCAGDPSALDLTFTDSATGLSVKSTRATWNAFNGTGAIDGNGASTGQNSGVYADSVERNFWIGSSSIQLILGGMVPGSSNRIRFYVSFNAATASYFGSTPVSYYINGVLAGTLSSVTSNYSQYIEGYGTADSSGNVTISSGSSTMNLGCLGVLEVRNAPASAISPVANAGAFTYTANSSATLDGSGSRATYGNMASYLWALISGDSGASLANSSSQVTVLSGLIPGIYQAQLTVQNSAGYTNTAVTEIRMWPSGTARSWYLSFGTATKVKTVGYELLNKDPASVGTGTYSLVHASLGWQFSFRGTDFSPIGTGTSVAAGPSTGNNSGFAPDSVLGQYWYSGSAKTADLYFNMGSVNAGRAILVQIYAGVSPGTGDQFGGVSGCKATYYVNGVSIGQLNLYNNTSIFVQTASGATTDINGGITIQSIGAQPGSTQFGIYNCIVVTLL